ncbi:MAG: protein-tyrosine kinase [Ruminococcaceae bacterium]|nr:protein-tyrosine kinase [Oscillospiraceae bacterium]
MEKQQESHEINILEFVFILLRKWWLILLAAVLCGSLMFAYTKFMVTPMYRSTAKLYVLPALEGEKISNSEAQMALTFTKDFRELITGRTVLEGVINDLELNMSYEGLASIVSSYSAEDSRIITISVSHADPVQAQKIANAICVEAESVLFNTVEADMLNISEKAHLPSNPYSPSMTKNVAVGVMGGILLVSGILLLIFIIDDKIKTPVDVEKQIGLSVLGVIPARVKTEIAHLETVNKTPSNNFNKK